MPQKPRPLDETLSARDWWGKELRNWRRARGLSSKALGAKVHLSGTSIERIEKNERPCDAALARLLDDALDAGGALVRLWRLVEEEAGAQRVDADKPKTEPLLDGFGGLAKGILGEHLPVLPDRSLSPVERRSLFALTGIAALGPGMFTDLLPKTGPKALPTVVRPEDIEQVRTAANTLAGWDNLYGGGGIARRSSIGLFIWAKDLLTLKRPPELDADLYTAVGRLSIVMGASAFDAYEHEDATHLLQFGTWCAEQAGNWHLRANALNWQARHEIWCGRPDAGLTHAENGLVRSDRLTHREQAMLHNARARAWAKMQNPTETLAAIGQSDDVFAGARNGEDAAWMAYYDEAQHYGDSGHALFDIALLPGQSPAMAARRLRAAIEGHTDEYVRSRALSGTKLATLIMATGDPQRAVAVAHRAMDEVGRLRSNRAVSDVQDLAKASARYARKSEVAELRERITTTVLV
ncbi:regulator [Streptomyces yokosukanensis]|uniref:Regulator n=1 Tax=Streptomyces yokosukanensis TaxID=67386 RepID=A0A101NZB5_9ACTN|nr:helix-turn-helix transcriptional regulator [Streptomyces yokosukanensis]KUN02061.1 regulator [Streptomyces yokosukanensis]